MEPVTVIGFQDENAEFDFIRAVNDATVRSLLRMAAAPDLATNAPVVQVRRMRATHQRFGPTGETFSGVFFLNRAAVDMCAAEHIAIAVVGQATAMPAASSYELEAQYVER